MNPRSFKRATFLAPGVCAVGKSLSGFGPSFRLTDPVGQTKLRPALAMFSQIVPALFATSTRKIYGEPYATLCAAVTICPVALTKLTITWLFCFVSDTFAVDESLTRNVLSPL